MPEPRKEAVKIYVLDPSRGRVEYAHIFPPAESAASVYTAAETHSAFPESKHDSSFIIKGHTSATRYPDKSLSDIMHLVRFVKYEGFKAYYTDGAGPNVEIISNSSPAPATGTAIFTFKVNPQNINIQKRKLFTKIRTRGGFEFQHWGADIGEITIRGTTGNIRPTGITFQRTQTVIGSIPIPRDESQEPRTVENTQLYSTFRALEDVYDNDQNDSAIKDKKRIALEYRDRIFVGHFANFSYEEDGERPFQLSYNLNFLVHYEATSFGEADSIASYNIQRNEETVRELQAIKRASAANTGGAQSDKNVG